MILEENIIWPALQSDDFWKTQVSTFALIEKIKERQKLAHLVQLNHTTVKIYRRNVSTNGIEHLKLVKEDGFRHISKINSGNRVSVEKLMFWKLAAT